MKKKNHILHVDGGFKTDQTYLVEIPRGQGYAKINHSSNERIELFLPTHDNTNNEAEFFAILCGITECIRTKKTTIYTDSQFCRDAIVKNWRLEEPRLQLINASIISLLSHYHLEINWLPRKENFAT